MNAKFDADSLLYLLSHFECDDHTVHMLIQWRLPPPLTSTVKSSLFTHTHSSPLSLAARLHPCHVNHFCYINNDWASSGQTICIHTYIYTHTYIHIYTHICVCVFIYIILLPKLSYHIFLLCVFSRIIFNLKELPSSWMVSSERNFKRIWGMKTLSLS